MTMIPWHIVYIKYGFKNFSTKNSPVELSGQDFASKARQIFKENVTCVLNVPQNGWKLAYALK
jgi:hypothetical protein